MVRTLLSTPSSEHSRLSIFQSTLKLPTQLRFLFADSCHPRPGRVATHVIQRFPLWHPEPFYSHPELPPVIPSLSRDPHRNINVATRLFVIIGCVAAACMRKRKKFPSRHKGRSHFACIAVLWKTEFQPLSGKSLSESLAAAQRSGFVAVERPDRLLCLFCRSMDSLKFKNPVSLQTGLIV